MSEATSWDDSDFVRESFGKIVLVGCNGGGTGLVVVDGGKLTICLLELELVHVAEEEVGFYIARPLYRICEEHYILPHSFVTTVVESQDF